MTPTRQGSFRLFRFAGIDVYLHWSWLAVAFYQVSNRTGGYSSPIWAVWEYLALFFIVLLHEFGHSLACRQVGGTSDQIVLWPLGGVAYVAPPQRAGAMLWSIAAGPLVNVALWPVLTALTTWSVRAGWEDTLPNLDHFLQAVWWVNTGLLVFNLLPIYPLDGGQILRSLLWFPLGRARSLLVASSIGFIGVFALAGLAIYLQSLWTGIMTYFIFSNCRSGFQQARALAAAERIPRRAGFACPSCGNAPPIGEFWTCGQCQTAFDTYASGATCPSCHTVYPTTRCLDCGADHPLSAWVVAGGRS